MQTNVPGNQLFLNSSGNVFGALNDLANALTTGNGIDAANTEVQQAFCAAEHPAASPMATPSASCRARRTYLNQEQVNLSTQQNQLVGANLTAVIANESQDQVDLEAALTATSQVLNLPSLLSYLK